MSTSTDIRFKRSSDAEIKSSESYKLGYGEPLFINANTGDYIVVGKVGNDKSTIKDSVFFRGMSYDNVDKVVVYDDDTMVVTNLANVPLKVQNVFSESITSIDGGEDDKYYIVCQDKNGKLFHFNLNRGIYINGKGVMHGAAWNDYAEGRTFNDEVVVEDLSGRVVCEDGHGCLKLSRERLQPCAYVISDTFGTTIGEGDINVAVAGKVLVCIDDEVELGDCVTAGFDGKAVKMTRQEIINYPDRILGIVIEVPDYDEYNGKPVNGRVWIKVK